MSKCSAILMVALALPGVVISDGLSMPDDYRAFVGDRRAFRVGDTLTVLILESTTAESAAVTGGNRKAAFSANISDGSHHFKGGLAIQGDTSGSARTTRRGQIQANVSVRVVELLAQGLMRVRGEQAVVINKERQQIRVSGIVRLDDISNDNTVLSYRLADGQFDITGDGVLADAQRRHFILRFLEWLRLS